VEIGSAKVKLDSRANFPYFLIDLDKLEFRILSQYVSFVEIGAAKAILCQKVYTKFYQYFIHS
jgi:hypothetical protein